MKTVTPYLVLSENINAIGYQGGDLFVRFNYGGGTCYRYEKVPEATYRDLCLAESKGKFLNESVKGRFTYKKLAQDPFEAPATQH
jgi:hypothetical protein